MSAIQPRSLITELNQLRQAARQNHIRFGTRLEKQIAAALQEYEAAFKKHQEADANYQDTCKARIFRDYRKARAEAKLKPYQATLKKSEDSIDSAISAIFREVAEELDVIPNPKPKIERALTILPTDHPHRQILRQWLEADQKEQREPHSLPRLNLTIERAERYVAIRCLLDKSRYLQQWTCRIRAIRDIEPEDSYGDLFYYDNVAARAQEAHGGYPKDPDEESYKQLVSAQQSSARQTSFADLIGTTVIRDLITEYAADDATYMRTHPKETLEDLIKSFTEFEHSLTPPLVVNEVNQNENIPIMDQIHFIQIRSTLNEMKGVLEAHQKTPTDETREAMHNVSKKARCSHFFSTLCHNANILSAEQVNNVLPRLSTTNQRVIRAWQAGNTYEYDPNVAIALHNLLSTAEIKELFASNLVYFAEALVTGRIVDAYRDQAADQQLHVELTVLGVAFANQQTIHDRAEAIRRWFAQGNHPLLENIQHLSLYFSNVRLFTREILDLIANYMNISTIDLNRDHFQRLPDTILISAANYKNLCDQRRLDDEQRYPGL